MSRPPNESRLIAAVSPSPLHQQRAARGLRTVLGVALASGLFMTPIAVHAAPAPHRAVPTQATTVKPQSERPASTVCANGGAKGGDHAAYACRESKSADLRSFEGGDAVVIAASTTTLIVAIILLVVLL